MRIAIVGAGPAGLTAANVFYRNGWPITVLENDASPQARDQGGTLDLHPNDGQLALAKAGLLGDFMRVARHEDQGERILDALTGEILREEIPVPGQGNRPEIDRLALRELLLRPLSGADLRWNAKVLSIAEHREGGIGIQLEQEFVGPFDLVIGADGSWSRVRASLTDVQPRYTGVSFVELWFSNVEHEQPEIAALVGRGTMFSLKDSKGIIAQRNGGGAVRVYAAFRTSPEAGERTDRTLAAITKADVLNLFEGWAPSLRALIERADRIAAVRPIVALPPGLRWKHHPNITLIGDAAHVMPPLGTGVNLAMLDAAELAETLVMSGKGIAALPEWEDRMLTRAEEFATETHEGFAQMFSVEGQATALDHLSARSVTDLGKASDHQ